MPAPPTRCAICRRTITWSKNGRRSATKRATPTGECETECVPGVPSFRGSAKRHEPGTLAALREDAVDEFDRIARAQLLHDAGAMDFDGAGTDAEPPARFLVRGAAGNEGEHFVFPPGEHLRSGKIGRDGRSRGIRCGPPRTRDGVAHAA